MTRALLQQALDALEIRQYAKEAYLLRLQAIEALQAAIAQPEPEPCGWLVFEGLMEKRRVGPIFMYRDVAKAYAEEIKSPTEVRALYTHPAPAKPLTDEVITEIACGAADEMWPGVGGVGWTKEDMDFYRIFCRKIEAMHGIGKDAPC